MDEWSEDMQRMQSNESPIGLESTHRMRYNNVPKWRTASTIINGMPNEKKDGNWTMPSSVCL
ncbi:hypothetical protein BLOT_000501 [Blomia tropicalis]|nr:hypothetical protein BLOT_000501 [Blomia tropicalis]